jgi:CRISPR-associated protein Csb2
MGPAGRVLLPYRLAVPNNQADRHIPALRKGARLDDLLRQDKELKQVEAVAVDRGPLIYAWEMEADEKGRAEAMRPIVQRLVVLGTGLDHAIADARVSFEPPSTAGMTEYRFVEAPCTGTLESLIVRHQAGLQRLADGGIRENMPPVRHDGGDSSRLPLGMLLFALRTPADADMQQSLPVAPETTAVLAHTIRQKLACELHEQIIRFTMARPAAAPPFSNVDVERFVLGRGAGPNDRERRVSVLPLPSIGHEHADGLLRRVLIVLPAGCPIAPEVVRRALNNAEIALNKSDGSPDTRLRLVRMNDDDPREQTMLQRYVGEGRVWRSVSPVVLPGAGSKYRPVADPAEQAALDVRRRCREEALTVRAVEHAGIDPLTIEMLRLRRDPFGPHQPRADARWQLPHDSEGRCWLAGKARVHAEIVFATERRGPLIIGDGRYLGLGLMTPGPETWRDLVVFGLASRPQVRVADRAALLGAVRRALMSLSRRDDGSIPRLFSGHEEDGAPAKSGRHEHVFLSAADLDQDGYIDSVIVAAPWRCDHSVRPSPADTALFDRVVTSLEVVQAGRLGIISLELRPCGGEDGRLVGPTRIWASHAAIVQLVRCGGVTIRLT